MAFCHSGAGAKFADSLGRSHFHYRRHGGKARSVLLQCLQWRIALGQAIENVPGSPSKAAKVPEDTGYAASTMATDGRRVYAIFANGDLCALNFDGAVVWT